MALTATERGARLNQQLLAFARKQPLVPVVVYINVLIREEAELLRRSLGEHFEVGMVLGGGLWRATVDKGQLQNALLNLAVNARDAMPEGGKVTIETSNAHLDRSYAAQHHDVPAGQYVLIAVSDTGHGMSREVQARAFEPFFTTKGPGKGTGLGLSMVYGIVKQSGGFIRVSSELGKGTSLEIYLPKIDASEAVMSHKSVVPPQPFKNKATILLVEDEDSLRDVIADFLQSGGHKVIKADSVGEACRKALELRLDFDLLLTDVVLKGGNGKQLVRRLEEQGCTFRVIYMSGYTPNAIVHHGVLDPGILFLQKPFSRSALLDKIEEALSADS